MWGRIANIVTICKSKYCEHEKANYFSKFIFTACQSWLLKKVLFTPKIIFKYASINVHSRSDKLLFLNYTVDSNMICLMHFKTCLVNILIYDSILFVGFHLDVHTSLWYSINTWWSAILWGIHHLDINTLVFKNLLYGATLMSD